MQTSDFIQVALFFGLVLALTPGLGKFMAQVFSGERTFLHRVLHPLELAI